MDKCCGTCAYHQYDKETDDWVCSRKETDV